MPVLRRSVLWRLAVDPAVRLSSVSIRDIEIPGDGIYRAAGALLDVPSLKTLMNGMADRVDFRLSGVSAEALRLAQEDRAEVYGAELLVGYVTFNPDWSYAAHRWTWRGTADVLAVASQPSDTGRERTITLSVASGDTLRSNPQITRYTDADQRRRSQTDAFFNRVANISQGATRRFGPK